MANENVTALSVQPREQFGSRSSRRARRAGELPGVVYGREVEAESISMQARDLRKVLAHRGAVIDLTVGSGEATPTVLKEVQYHPVSGNPIHIDFLRVDLKKLIHATVSLEFVGVENAPGVKLGGVLEQHLREVNVEALPTALPDTIEVDVSSLDIHDTITLAAVTIPEGVAFLDELTTTVAIITPPRVDTSASGEAGAVEAAAGSETANKSE